MLTRTNQPASAAAFLITIDTEGDNLWARTHDISTRNSAFLPRFQALCERYSLKPTYLTNWEMAACPVFREFAKDALRSGTAEIGMHLHAWNSPPIIPLTQDDYVHHPYLIEYPEQVLREKVKVMTETLQEVFGESVVSHRAGRWAFNEVYARALIDCGYQVDCSVTPHVSWRPYKGDPEQNGGSDYSAFPEAAYFVDPMDIRRPGNSPLLEVPVTVARPVFTGPLPLAARGLARTSRFSARVARHFYPDIARLIPNGQNRRYMLGLLSAAELDRRDHVEFMLHSSELMPGGSPNFRTERSIERLYEDMEAVFARARTYCIGLTLREYHDRFAARTASGVMREPSAQSSPWRVPTAEVSR